ncbi:hypothetical protein [Pseudomonas aeruginosa]|uniref:hypothetical protein n=1 Tax=Pseudomonas aeruginosa TaxID=287 RepID=UPI003965772F
MIVEQVSGSAWAECPNGVESADEARAKASAQAMAARDEPLAERIKQFRFSDIRPKAASEIDDLADASKLLGHTKEQITKKVYRRVGEVVKPTR